MAGFGGLFPDLTAFATEARAAAKMQHDTLVAILLELRRMGQQQTLLIAEVQGLRNDIRDNPMPHEAMHNERTRERGNSPGNGAKAGSSHGRVPKMG